jgi:hypothetical protein
MNAERVSAEAVLAVWRIAAFIANMTSAGGCASAGFAEAEALVPPTAGGEASLKHSDCCESAGNPLSPVRIKKVGVTLGADISDIDIIFVKPCIQKLAPAHFPKVEIIVTYHKCYEARGEDAMIRLKLRATGAEGRADGGQNIRSHASKFRPHPAYNGAEDIVGIPPPSAVYQTKDKLNLVV